MKNNVRILKGKVVVQDQFSAAVEEYLKAKHGEKKTFEFWRTTLPSLRFLETLKGIERLSLTNCVVHDATALSDLGTLNHLFLNGVKFKGGWDFLADLKQVESLHILNVRGELTLPNLASLDSLNTIQIWGCKGLRDISSLLDAPNLEEVALTDTGLQHPDDLLELFKKPSVRFITARFGTNKKNDLFSDYLQAYDKRQYRDP